MAQRLQRLAVVGGEVRRSDRLQAWFRRLPAARRARLASQATRANVENPVTSAVDRLVLLDALLDHYQQTVGRTIRAGIANHHTAFRAGLRQMNACARLVDDLGFFPGFHVRIPAYWKRVARLVCAADVNSANGWKALYQEAMRPWHAGGLAVGWPAGATVHTPGVHKVLEINASCWNAIKGRLDGWGNCTNLAMRTIPLVLAGVAACDSAILEPRIVIIGNIFADAEVHRAYGRSLRSGLGHTFLAVRGMGTTIALDPSGYGFAAERPAYYQESPLLRGMLGLLYQGSAQRFLDNDQIDVALYLLDQAEALTPNATTAMYFGLLRLIQERYDEAEAYFLRAVQCAPTQFRALLHLSRLYWEQGEPDKARAALRRVEWIIAPILSGQPRSAHDWEHGWQPLTVSTDTAATPSG